MACIFFLYYLQMTSSKTQVLVLKIFFHVAFVMPQLTGLMMRWPATTALYGTMHLVWAWEQLTIVT